MKAFNRLEISSSEGDAVDLCFQRKEFSVEHKQSYSLELSKVRILFGNNMLESYLGFNSLF